MRSRGQMRTDGKRFHCRSYSWGNLGPVHGDVDETRAHYNSDNWDGVTSYSHAGNVKVPGVITLLQPPKSESHVYESMSRRPPVSYLVGYNMESDERMDSILRKAQNISVSSRMENVGGSDCYVIRAKMDQGMMSLWIDPAHGYNLAKAETRLSQGDFAYGRQLKRGESRVTRLKNVRFEKVNGVWVPMEADVSQYRNYGKGTVKEDYHYKRTEFVLNPDHDALGSFDNPIDNPKNDPELKNGTDVHRLGDPNTYIWQDGRLVDENGNRVVSPSAQETSSVQTLNVSVADLDRSRTILSRKDEFITSMGAFDRSIRMKTAEPVSEEKFLHFLSTNVVSWKAEEIAKVDKSLDSIKDRIFPFSLTFPQAVLLIKTTGKEELGGIYTRGNAIVVPEKTLNLPQDEIEALIIDELFHIFLRHNPRLRDALCELIGFGACNEIEIPHQLLSSKITDPDAPKNDHYITVSYENSIVNVVPIILAVPGACKLNDRGMSCYSVACKLLVVEKGQKTWKPKFRDSQPVLLDVSAVSGFFEKVGRNSDHIFHPEEILADNFVMLTHGKKDVPTPSIILQMKKLLTK